MQIVFDHVTKKFDEGSIGLEKVSFEVQKGEFVDKTTECHQRKYLCR